MWRDRELLVLLAAGSLTVMTGAVVAPVLPEIIQDLNLDRSLAGNLVSMHYLTLALSSPVLGILADRLGGKRVLVASLVFYALFGLAGAAMPSFWPLLLTRAAIGVASGGIAAASLGLLVQLYSSQEARSQAIAYVASALTLANILYPVLAGALGSISWQAAFGLYGLGLPLAATVALQVRQPTRGDGQGMAAMTGDGAKLSQVLRNPNVLRLLLTLTLSSATVYAVVIYLPIYLKELMNASTALNGGILTVQALGSAVTSAFGARWLAKRFGLTLVTAAGFGVMALMVMTLPNLSHLSSIVPVAILFGMGFGAVTPSLYTNLANFTPEGMQGSVLAAGTGAGFLGQFLSPILFGLILAQGSIAGVFYTATSVALAAGLLLLVPIRA